MTSRLGVLKTVLWASVGVLAAITVVRFTRGLGAVTNLSDAAPWGLWIGFDVMAGVALAAGGFVLAATVYVFGLERYRPFVRPAILTAWLGYIAVAVGLLYDLGLPWNIWHPMIYWQHHSVLFEVAACVMLYLTVLTLEFAPVVLEHPFFQRPLFRMAVKVLKKGTILLVILGIVLSTLHQSSLGSLFLIAPFRLHPLWYSPIIYVLFFVSAVGLGLMMVTLESLLSAYFLGHRLNREALAGLGLAASVVLWVYVALRVGDLAARGVLPGAIDGSWQSNWFVVELAWSAVIPAALLLSRRVRSSVAGLAACAAMAVSGLVLHRLDVSIVAFARPEGAGYFPTWAEFGVSIGIVSCCVLVFLFFVERFKVYEEEGGAAATPERAPVDPATAWSLAPPSFAPYRYSLVAVSAAVLALAFLPVRGASPRTTPVAAALAVDGRAIERDGVEPRNLVLAHMEIPIVDAVVGAEVPASLARLLAIDGNRDGTLVLFDHDAHAEREGGDPACAICHHLDLPYDRASSCSECHRDMYEPTRLFSHASHVTALDGNDGCTQCHADDAEIKTLETSTACVECHETPEAPGAAASGEPPLVPSPNDRWLPASGYMDAMHGLCLGCHQRRTLEEPARWGDALDRCDACHDADFGADLRALTPKRNSGGRTSVGRTDDHVR